MHIRAPGQDRMDRKFGPFFFQTWVGLGSDTTRLGSPSLPSHVTVLGFQCVEEGIPYNCWRHKTIHSYACPFFQDIKSLNWPEEPARHFSVERFQLMASVFFYFMIQHLPSEASFNFLTFAEWVRIIYAIVQNVFPMHNVFSTGLTV